MADGFGGAGERHPILFIAIAGAAGFCAYVSIYVFRKPRPLNWLQFFIGGACGRPHQWKRFGPWLGPLRASLRNAVKRYRD